jgi:hypothetical protein
LSSDEQQEITLLLLLLRFVAATLLPDPLEEGQAEDEEALQPRSCCTADGGRGDATLIISSLALRLPRFSQIQSFRHSCCSNLYDLVCRPRFNYR